MALERLRFDSRDEWLAFRRNGIGASEAAAAVGLSPWQTPLELWKVKTGIMQPKDLSGNAAVEQGNRMEPAIRAMFTALHPELEIEYHQLDVLYQAERPWLYATLDGEITRKSDGKRGILEIKTATPNGKTGWAAWSDGNMPQNYYTQTLHQLSATGYDFVYLFAALYSLSGDITLREYEMSREDVTNDMRWLLRQETDFWGYVQRGTMPPMPLTL